ncbi:GL14805 [Drosophila persimilis]|uniref:GL14805 n=1 Tax=Drosophila persimilis TaxID=7234 RepID=B4GQ33_DROPE|nr:GL14805 [Drosophila persimilis]
MGQLGKIQAEVQIQIQSQSPSHTHTQSQEQLYAREVRELLAWCERFNNGGVENFE